MYDTDVRVYTRYTTQLYVHYKVTHTRTYSTNVHFTNVYALLMYTTHTAGANKYNHVAIGSNTRPTIQLVARVPATDEVASLLTLSSCVDVAVGAGHR